MILIGPEKDEFFHTFLQFPAGKLSELPGNPTENGSSIPHWKLSYGIRYDQHDFGQRKRAGKITNLTGKSRETCRNRMTNRCNPVGNTQ
jgi:hypothetical protein